MSAGADAAPEHPERPGLVGQHDRREDHRDPGHDASACTAWTRRCRRVRLNAGSVVEGSTSGYSEPNRVTVTATIAPAVPANAHPSRPQPVRDERGDQRAGRGEHRDAASSRHRRRLGPEQERRRRRRTVADADPARQGTGPGPDVPGGLEGQEHRAVQREQQQRGQPAEQRVGVEQGEQGAGVLVLGVQRDTGHDVGERDAPQQRRARASRPRSRRPSCAATGRCRPCRGTRRRPRARSARPG